MRASASRAALVYTAADQTREEVRDKQKPQMLAAPQGMYQQMLGGKTAQMLRLRLDREQPCVPEISANKYALNIRFVISGSRQKTRIYEEDVEFELRFCNL